MAKLKHGFLAVSNLANGWQRHQFSGESSRYFDISCVVIFYQIIDIYVGID